MKMGERVGRNIQKLNVKLKIRLFAKTDGITP